MKINKNLFKKFYRWLNQKFTAYYCLRYYQSIKEMPIQNWWDVHEDKDLKHLLKQKKKLTNHAAIVFDKLYSEFISIFGISDNYRKYLEKISEIEIAEIDMVLTKDSSLETFIDIMKIELEEIKSNSEGGSYIDTKIVVEKNMGFRLNPKETTVFEYYSYIKALEKNGK
jgi:hypothetical protein